MRPESGPTPMDLKREALTGTAQLAAIALALRRLYQPDFEAPKVIRDILSEVDMTDVSWQQVATLAKSVQSLNAGWSAEGARRAA